MHRKNRITGKTIKQAVLHHLAGAAQTFFGGLKNQVQCPVKLPACSKMLRRGQQHGGMAVVPAGMHQARMATGVGQARGLLNGQGVHIGAQSQFARATAALELTDHACATQTAGDAVAPALQSLCHQVTGSKLLKTDFGMLMDIAAQCGVAFRTGQECVGQ